eukprot:4168238-Pleurochrysis_carterae.AAC.1
MKGQWLLVTPRGAKEVKCVEKEVGALDATWADGSAKWLGMATELLQLGWMPFGEFKFRMLRRRQARATKQTLKSCKSCAGRRGVTNGHQQPRSD